MNVDKMKLARYLKDNGFDPSVAGAEDFNGAVEAIASALELNKGLMVFGKCGVGKSLLCRITAKVMLKEGHKVFIMGDTMRGTDLIRDSDWVFDAINNGALIDDIGTEFADSNYGQPRELVSELIYTMQWHYEAYPGKGMVIANTNLTPTEFAKRYGQRTFSRLAGMTHLWTMKGEDKRGKSKTTKEGTFINGVKREVEAIDYAKAITSPRAAEPI